MLKKLILYICLIIYYINTINLTFFFNFIFSNLTFIYFFLFQQYILLQQYLHTRQTLFVKRFHLQSTKWLPVFHLGALVLMIAPIYINFFSNLYINNNY